MGRSYEDFLTTPFPVIELAMGRYVKFHCAPAKDEGQQQAAQPERSPDEVASGLMAALRGHKAFKRAG